MTTTPASFRPYRDGDEARMAARPDMAEQFAALGERVHDGPKYALVDGDRLLGVGGIAYDDDDASWDLWCLCGEMRPRHWLQVRDFVLGLVGKATEDGSRVWVMASPGCEAAERFIRRLGFRASAEKGVFYV